ncbi:MAG: 4-hydroxyphenylpyruvate dioxygenase [Rhizomicrobium sp.]
MGAPVDRESEDGIFPVRENPMGTDGLAFMEFSATDPTALAVLFAELGFVKIADHVSRPVSLWRQRDISFILNGDPQTHGGRFAAVHGPCVSAIAFKVSDAGSALARALAMDASAYAGDAPKTVDAPALEGIGGSLLYLIDPKIEETLQAHAFRSTGIAAPRPGALFSAVDHLTHNVRAGGLETWMSFYKRLFGFREIFYLDARGASTGFRTYALMSPCDKICIPINEPSDPKSQIQEFIDLYKGEGVQHIALAATDICASVERVANSGISFMGVPKSYYDAVEDRLPSHGEDLERLKRNSILIDGERNAKTGDWDLLLQIFSKNLIGPIFLEFIQRKGNRGFGEGNARALFEAIERDQIERGVVSAA